MLVRDFGALSRSFHAEASYIWLDEAARHGIDFAMHGPQFSRGFAALKVWVSLLAHGRAAYGRRIAHDAALARYLGELVEEHPDFELMCEPRLSICCFRYRPRGWDGDEEELDRLNERLMTAIQADGRVYCSNAVIDGRFGLRACIVNFRTEAEDVERLLAVAAELGELEQQARRPDGLLRHGAGHGDAGLVGEHDGLHAVAQPELHQHARDVRLHRRLAHDQLGRDLRVREPARDELEHLELARGQLVEALRRRRGRPARRTRTPGSAAS